MHAADPPPPVPAATELKVEGTQSVLVADTAHAASVNTGFTYELRNPSGGFVREVVPQGHREAHKFSLPFVHEFATFNNNGVQVTINAVGPDATTTGTLFLKEGAVLDPAYGTISLILSAETRFANPQWMSLGINGFATVVLSINRPPQQVSPVPSHFVADMVGSGQARFDLASHYTEVDVGDNLAYTYTDVDTSGWMQSFQDGVATFDDTSGTDVFWRDFVFTVSDGISSRSVTLTVGSSSSQLPVFVQDGTQTYRGGFVTAGHDIPTGHEFRVFAAGTDGALTSLSLVAGTTAGLFSLAYHIDGAMAQGTLFIRAGATITQRSLPVTVAAVDDAGRRTTADFVLTTRRYDTVAPYFDHHDLRITGGMQTAGAVLGWVTVRDELPALASLHINSVPASVGLFTVSLTDTPGLWAVVVARGFSFNANNFTCCRPLHVDGEPLYATTGKSEQPLNLPIGEGNEVIVVTPPPVGNGLRPVLEFELDLTAVDVGGNVGQTVLRLERHDGAHELTLVASGVFTVTEGVYYTGSLISPTTGQPRWDNHITDPIWASGAHLSIVGMITTSIVFMDEDLEGVNFPWLSYFTHHDDTQISMKYTGCPNCFDRERQAMYTVQVVARELEGEFRTGMTYITVSVAPAPPPTVSVAVGPRYRDGNGPFVNVPVVTIPTGDNTFDGMTTTIDLDEMFYDPDGGALAYESSGVRDIANHEQITIDGSHLLVNRRRDYGNYPDQTHHTFTVTDSGGDTMLVTLTIQLTRDGWFPQVFFGGTQTLALVENQATEAAFTGVTFMAAKPRLYVRDVMTVYTSSPEFSIQVTRSGGRAWGSIFVKPGLEFDYESRQVVTADVNVEDGQLSNLAHYTFTIQDIEDWDSTVSVGEHTETRMLEEVARPHETAAERLIMRVTDRDTDLADFAFTHAHDDVFTLAIDGGDAFTLEVLDGVVLDYETKPSYTLSVAVTNTSQPEYMVTLVYTINVIDGNDAPSLAFPTYERVVVEEVRALAAGGVATFAVSDPNGDALRFHLMPASVFVVDHQQGAAQAILRVRPGQRPDHETRPSYPLALHVTDAAGLSSPTVVFTVSVVDADDEPPALDINFDGHTVTENVAAPAEGVEPLATITVTDVDTAPYAVFAQASTDRFTLWRSVTPEEWLVGIRPGVAFDHEDPAGAVLDVTFSDYSGNSSAGQLSLAVVNVNDTPPRLKPGRTFIAGFGTGRNYFLTLSLYFEDLDGDTLTYEFSDRSYWTDSKPANGVLTVYGTGRESGNFALVTVSDGVHTIIESFYHYIVDRRSLAPAFHIGGSGTIALVDGTRPSGEMPTGLAVQALLPNIQLTVNAPFTLRQRTQVLTGGGTDNLVMRVPSATVVTEIPAYTLNASMSGIASLYPGRVIPARTVTETLYTVVESSTYRQTVVVHSLHFDAAAYGLGMDYETVPALTATVAAYIEHGQWVLTQAVVFDVLDVDDEAPVVHQMGDWVKSYAENQTLAIQHRTPIRFRVSDVDTDLSSVTVSHDNIEEFVVIGGSGGWYTLVVANPLTLDYEARPLYRTSVTVRDAAGNATSLELRLQVTDVNEGPRAMWTLAAQTFHVGGDNRVDIRWMFIDFEFDQVTYSASPAEHLSVSADGFVLTANHDAAVAATTGTVLAWSGTQTATMAFTYSFAANAPPRLFATGVQRRIAEGMVTAALDTGREVEVAKPGGSITMLEVTPANQFSLAHTELFQPTVYADLFVLPGVDLDRETGMTVTVTATGADGQQGVVEIPLRLDDADEQGPTLVVLDGVLTLAENRLLPANEAIEQLTYTTIAYDTSGDVPHSDTTVEFVVDRSIPIPGPTLRAVPRLVVNDADSRMSDMSFAVSDGRFTLYRTAQQELVSVIVHAGVTHHVTTTVNDAAELANVWELGLVEALALDHEATAAHVVTATVRDPQGQVAQATFTLVVTDVNDEPVAQRLAAPVGFRVNETETWDVATLFHDDDGDTLDYFVSPGGGMFTIDANGVLTATSAAAVAMSTAVFGAFDSPAPAQPGASLAGPAVVTFTFSFSSNRPPVIRGSGGQTLTLTDGTTSTAADTGHLFTVTDDDDISAVRVEPAAVFAVAHGALDSNNEVVTLRFKAGVALDHETVAGYTATVYATDSGGNEVAATPVSVSVLDVDEVAPMLILPSPVVTLTENVRYGKDEGLPLADFLVLDDDATAAQIDVTNTESFLFTVLSGGTPMLYTLAFRAAQVPDHETRSSYTVSLTATDSAGMADTGVLVVSVVDVDEPPQAVGEVPRRVFPADGTASTVMLGDLVTEDDGETLTWSVLSQSDPGFTISVVDGAAGVVAVSRAADSEEILWDRAIMAAADAASSVELTFTLGFRTNARPLIERLGSQTLGLTDGTTTPAVVDTGLSFTVTDADGDDITLVALAPGSPTAVLLTHTTNGSTAAGGLRFAGGVMLDHEVVPTYIVTLLVDDAAGLRRMAVFRISVTDVDDTAPVLSEPGTVTVVENTAYSVTAGLAGGELTVTDPDTALADLTVSNSDAARFTMVNDGANGLFTLAFLVDTTPDHEMTPSHLVTVTVRDGGGQVAHATFHVAVADINEAPTVMTSLDVQNWLITTDNVFTVHDLFGDPDADTNGVDLTYTVMPSSVFTQVDGVVTASSAVEVSGQTGTVVATDSGGLSDTMTFTYNFDDNVLPAGLVISIQTLTLLDGTTSEDTPTGVVVRFFDADIVNEVAVAPTMLFSLAGFGGSQYVWLTLHFRAGLVIDHETQAAHVATFRATDSNNGVGTLIVTLTVTDVDDTAPVLSEPGTVTLAENATLAATAGIAGAELTVTDPDTTVAMLTVTNTDDTVFTLVNGGSDKLFTLAFIDETVADHEAKDAYEVTVTVNDGTNGMATAVFKVTVPDVNEKPTIKSQLGSRIFGTSLANVFTVTDNFGDPDDGDTLTFTVSPAAIFTGTGGTVTAMSGSEASNETGTVVATDSQGLAETMFFTYAFSHNQPPTFTLSGDQTKELKDGETSTAGDTGHEVTFTDPDSADTISTVSVTPTMQFEVDYTPDTNEVAVTLRFKGGIVLDYDDVAKRTHVATIKATDDRGAESAAVVVTLSVTDVDDVDPTLSAAKLVELVENTTLSVNQPLPNGDLTVTDPDTAHDDLTVSVSGSMFTMVSEGGKAFTLAVINQFVPDHEAATNSYTVVVTVEDGHGATVTEEITVTIPNVNEAPITTQAIPAATWPTSMSHTFTVTQYFDDPDLETDSSDLAYTVTPSSVFTETNGVVTASSTVAVSGQTGTVVASDGTLAVTLEFTYSFIHNNPPGITIYDTQNLELKDGEVSGYANTGMDADFSDYDGGIDMYSVEPSSIFSLVVTDSYNNQAFTDIYIKAGITHDYETQTAYVATIKATDNRGAQTEKLATVTVTPANDEAPSVSTPVAAVTVTENVGQVASVGLVNGSVTVMDADHDNTPMSMTVTNSGTVFTMVNGGTDYAWTLAFKNAVTLDHEAKGSYTVTVTVDDNSTDNADALTTITVEVANANDAPYVKTSLTMQAFQTSVSTTVTVFDLFEDQDVTTRSRDLIFTVMPTEDFSIAGGLLTASSNDEDDSDQTGTIEASDGTLTATMEFTYRFEHNAFPVGTLQGTQALELTDNTTTTMANTGYTIEFSDADMDDTITAVAVTPVSAFDVSFTAGNGTTATVFFKAGIVLDYETQTSYVATVKATDSRGGESAGVVLTMTVTDVDDVDPTFSTAQLVELVEDVALTAGALLPNGDLTVTDPDTAHDRLTVSVSGSRFTMASAGGKAFTLALSSSFTPNHEDAINSYTVTATVTDGHGGMDTAVFTVTIPNVNEAPYTTGTLAATLWRTSVSHTFPVTQLFDDPDNGTDGTNLIYTVQPAAVFSVTAGVVTASSNNEATAATGTVFASDGTVTVSLPFTYTFQHNQFPTFTLSGTQNKVLTDGETSTAGDTGHLVTFTDPDPGDMITMVSVEPSTVFEVGQITNANEVVVTLKFKAGIVLDYDDAAKRTYVATLKATDSRDGESAGALVTVSVTPANDEAPTWSTPGTVMLTENATQPAGTGFAMGELTVTDGDHDTTATMMTVSNSDDGVFTMVNHNNDLVWTLAFVAQTTLDFETRQGGFTVTVTVSDGSNLTPDDTSTITVMVADVNEAPYTTGMLAATLWRTSVSHTFTVTQLFDDPDNGTDGTNLTYTVQPTTVFSVTNGVVTANSTTEATNETGTLIASDGNLAVTMSFTYSFQHNQYPTFTQSGSQTKALTDGETSTAGDTGHVLMIEDPDIDGTITAVTIDLTTFFEITDPGVGQTVLVTLRFKEGIAIDHERKTSYTVTVTATDNRQGSSMFEVTMTVDDVDDTSPTISAPDLVTLVENMTVSATVPLPDGVITVGDQDTMLSLLTVTHSDTSRFTLLNGSRDQYFTLAFNTNTVPDHETTPSYTVTVTVSDGRNAVALAAYTVSVTDVNDNPPSVQAIADQTYLTSVTVTVDYAGYFSDADAIDMFTSFTIDLTGNASKFIVEGSTLIVNGVDMPTTVEVAVEGVSGGETVTANFNITIIDRDIQKFAELLQEPAAELVALVARDIGTASAGRAAAAVSSGPSPALIAMLRAKSAELEKGELTLEKFLAGNSFSFVGANLAGGLGSIAYWGGGDYSQLEAKRDDATRLSWDGSLFGGNVGIELRTGESVFGLGINHSRGDFDYRYRSGTDYRGTLEFSMNSVFPYFTHKTGGGTELHGVVSAGRGEMKATEGTNCQTDLCYTSDLEQLSFLVGFNTPLRGDNLRVRGEVGTGQVTADMPVSSQPVVGLGELSADTGHAELGLEYRGSASGTFRPSFLLGVRNDFGDAVEGWGAEVGARVASTATRGLTFDAGVRYVMRKEGYREYGVDGTFRYEPRLPGLGLRWQVQPGYGIDMGAQDVTGILDGLGDDRARLPDVKGARVKAEVSYGLLLADGLFTPRLSFERGDHIDLYGLDLRYQVGAFSWTYGWKRKHHAPLEVLTKLELRI